MKCLILLVLSVSCFAQDLRRPLSDVDGGNNLNLGCSGQNTGSAAMPKAYDSAGLATYSSNVTTGTTVTLYSTRIFQGWVKSPSSYNSLTLNVYATSPGWRNTASGGLTGNACVAYSKDSGNTWTSFVCDGGISGGNGFSGLYTATLSTSQDLSRLRVAVCTQGTGTSKGINGADEVDVFDIYTLGTTGAPPAGNGATNGQPHRGVVVVN